MKREEAILNAAEIANILDKRGLNGAANSLRESLKVLCTPRNPWVRTADRFPEGKDAFEDKVLVYNFVERRQQLKLWLIVRTYPHVFPYWMPIPLLPEEEE